MWTVHLQGSNGEQRDPSFTTGKVKIGKDADCDLRLPGWRVSGRHAELFVSNEQGFLRDLGGGTLVNGKSITTHGPLTAHDTIQVGAHLFTARWTADAENSEAPPAPARAADARGNSARRRRCTGAGNGCGDGCGDGADRTARRGNCGGARGAPSAG